MIIDMHTHLFPDALAPRAVKSLENGIFTNHGYNLPMFSDATLSGLLKSMDENEIDMSIVLPIATNPRQTETINEFAKKITGARVISLGSVHPCQDDWKEVLHRLKSNGFLGIKLHPEFQQSYIDSPETLRVLEECEKLDMAVVVHAGVDLGVKPPVHCTPKHMRHALEYVSGKRLVAAHLGGYLQWDEVEEYLIDTDVIFDVSMISRYIDPEQCRRIIEKHGADKIVYGSDSPWEGQRDAYNFLQKLELSKEDMELIAHKNQKRILGI